MSEPGVKSISSLNNSNNHVGASGYLPGIDGLRAIAVIAVIVYHIDSWSVLPGGFTGVDVFFVISGYVISKSLMTRPFVGLPDFISGFYKGRILRIFPALIVCLIVTIIFSALFIPASWLSETNIKTGLFAFFGFSNYEIFDFFSRNRFFWLYLL
ncbi:MAG: acyltransferase [Desulfarculaceae bacterium]|nr:acyltransferase [Desulfarculaceae bacterium]MCF8118294.1 acyltransferase [Desulfarculaceae bacterium]